MHCSKRSKTTFEVTNIESENCLAYAPKCIAEGSAISQAICGTGVSFVILTSDFLGQKKSKGGDLVKSYISDKGATFREEVIIKDNKDGTYGGFYNLAKEGTFFLNIFIYEEPIKGSPFNLELVQK